LHRVCPQQNSCCGLVTNDMVLRGGGRGELWEAFGMVGALPSWRANAILMRVVLESEPGSSLYLCHTQATLCTCSPYTSPLCCHAAWNLPGAGSMLLNFSTSKTMSQKNPLFLWSIQPQAFYCSNTKWIKIISHSLEVP
jgi:hypothetical protein